MKKADIKKDGTCVDPDQTLTRHHIQVQGLKVKTRIKGGKLASNHNQTLVRVRT